MALLPRYPLNEMDRFRQQFNNFFSDFPNFADFNNGVKADVYETDKEVVVTCNIPGIERKEDIHINVDQNELHISGKVHRSNEVKEEHMHRQERYTGTFQRSLPLPSPVSDEGVKASYKNGVLEVTMPKTEKDDKKRIDVEFN